MELLPGYEDSITAMAAAVREAKEFVNAEFYIMSTDHITDELLTASRKPPRAASRSACSSTTSAPCGSRATAS